MSTRVAIVGSGAMGSYVGGHMTRAGEDVVLIDQYPDHVERIRTEGLEIAGVVPRDNFKVKVRSMHLGEAQSLAKQDPIDVAFITIKSYDSEWAAALIKQYLAPDGCVISLQNGINEERIASVVGWGRTLGVTIAGCGVELLKPGFVQRANSTPEGHTVYRAGELHGRTTGRAQEVARLLSAVDVSGVTNNLWGERWSKLVANSMRNGLAALTGLGIPDQDRNEITRSIMIRLGSETVRVGQALGYTLVKTFGIEPETLARGGEGDKAAIDECTKLLLKFADTFDVDALPSMAQDAKKGRRTEIGEINGMIVERGAEAGVPTPINERMRDSVKKLERGEIKAGLDAVKDF